MAKQPEKNFQKRFRDPVSEMRIHRESLKKQHDHSVVYENFKINQPKKVNFYAEKPNNNPFLLMKYRNQGRTINGVDIDDALNDEMHKSSLTNQISDKLKTVTQIPKDKWSVPQTTNQQFGWHINKSSTDSKFIYKRQGCPQTHYADSYYTMSHASLFSNHKQK